MKSKLLFLLDANHKKGHEIEWDSIRYDDDYAGNYKVRIVGKWKKPKWISIRFVVRDALYRKWKR